ncbi:MAG: hypothetical protein PHT16_00800 [Candidatus Pacebacteria bacterium]|nr:hypothetical protein [Candidatus Paceibacterota bacterium]
MLYLFSGDDSKNKILNYEKFIKSLSEKKGVPPSDIFFINRNDFDPVQIESFYSGASLFSTLSVIVFQNIFEYEETRDFVLDKLKQMGESDNIFIFSEGKLKKPILDAFKKIGEKRVQINIFELPKQKLEKFDNFLVANAFANKDKLNTWIYFRQAMDAGVIMEEIIGVLFWKIKDMLLKNNFNKFSPEQLKTFASKISYLLPEARKEGRDAESAFEQFLLEAF